MAPLNEETVLLDPPEDITLNLDQKDVPPPLTSPASVKQTEDGREDTEERDDPDANDIVATQDEQPLTFMSCSNPFNRGVCSACKEQIGFTQSRIQLDSDTYIHKDCEQLREQSANKIQTKARGYMGRIELQKLRAEKQREIEEKAAKLQSAQKGWKTIFYSKKEREEQEAWEKAQQEAEEEAKQQAEEAKKQAELKAKEEAEEAARQAANFIKGVEEAAARKAAEREAAKLKAIEEAAARQALKEKSRTYRISKHGKALGKELAAASWSGTKKAAKKSKKVAKKTAKETKILARKSAVLSRKLAGQAAAGSQKLLKKVEKWSEKPEAEKAAKTEAEKAAFLAAKAEKAAFLAAKAEQEKAAFPNKEEREEIGSDKTW